MLHNFEHVATIPIKFNRKTIAKNTLFLLLTQQHIYQFQKKMVSFILKRIRSSISEQTAISEIIQRNALRAVFCKDRLCSRLELYSENFLPVSAMGQFSSALFWYFKFQIYY